MDESFRNSKFAVIFEGDATTALLRDGFEAAMEAIRREFWGDDAEPVDWSAFMADLLDSDNWIHNDLGPFSYREEIGDAVGLTVYRLDERD